MVDMNNFLRNQLGSDYPISTGSLKRDDPLIVTELRDYVSVEHEVARFVLDNIGLCYKLEKQQVQRRNGRVIDELVYATREPDQQEWTQRRRFFFDITAGITGSIDMPDAASLPSRYSHDSPEVQKLLQELEPTPEEAKEQEALEKLIKTEIRLKMRWIMIIHRLGLVAAFGVLSFSLFGTVSWLISIPLALFAFLIIFHGGKRVVSMISRKRIIRGSDA